LLSFVEMDVVGTEVREYQLALAVRGEGKLYAKSTDVPTQLEYGVEVCSTTGAETFPMTGLTFSLS
jgi:hypothetical protein